MLPRGKVLLAMLLVSAVPAIETTQPALSVYRTDPWIDGAVIAAGAAAAILPYALAEDLIGVRCPCDPAELNALDRRVVGNESDLAYAFATLTTGLAMAAPFAVDIADVYHSPAFLEDALVYAETLAISSGAVALTKHLRPRPLPLVYADPTTALAGRAEGYRAFYSGHMSGAVSMMTALAMTHTYRYGASAWPWLLDAGVALVVGAGVIASGRHFYTDVLAGTAVGFGLGVFVPWIHRVTPVRAISVRPAEEGDGALLLVGGSL